MQRSTLNYRTAFVLALAISLLLNILFVIMFFYGRDAVLPPDGARPRNHFDLDILLSHILSNFVVAFLLYVLNFKLIRRSCGSSGWVRWLAVIGITLVATALVSYACSKAQAALGDFGPNPVKFIRGSMMRDYFIAVIVILSSQLLHITGKQQQTALENETLVAENMRNRFTALRNQTDPHFLFNSLNTLNSLIRTDADKAQEYVQQLSQVFRYTLQNKEVITLRDEMNFTESYCHLMGIRYGDSLRFDVDVDESLTSSLIIPLSLQTLVENAIKHNVVSKRRPLAISITADDDAIRVSNPVQSKKEEQEGEGIGLANLSEHYRLRWKKEIRIVRTGGRFEVTIPLIKNESPDRDPR